jgi:hypothetical protein
MTSAARKLAEQGHPFGHHLTGVNTPPPKGGGFELRLKAGLVRLRRT